MTIQYGNIPDNKTPSSSDQTVEVFNNYYKLPVTVNNNELMALIGFFQSKGFEPVAAESAATTILIQAVKDGYNAMQIMDTLKSLGSVEISGLVAEILNFNRLKTSFLGVAGYFSPSDEVKRNVLP
jgi:hypothetical protein